jgi:hypothetical protein
MVRPLVILMSEPEAATAQWITTVPPDVCRVAAATAVAFPVAFVSEVMAFAEAVPPEEAAKPVADKLRVATAVPGAPTEPARRKTNFPLAPISARTASVAALRAAVEWVVAIFYSIWLYVSRADHVTDQLDCLFLAGTGAGNLQDYPHLSRWPR